MKTENKEGTADMLYQCLMFTCNYMYQSDVSTYIRCEAVYQWKNITNIDTNTRQFKKGLTFNKLQILNCMTDTSHNLVNTLEIALFGPSNLNFIGMRVLILSSISSKLGHVRSITRSQGQFEGQSLGGTFIFSMLKLCQNNCLNAI